MNNVKTTSMVFRPLMDDTRKQGTENAHVPARQALQAQKKTYTSKTASGSQVHYLFLIAYGEFGFRVKRLEFRM